jgi:hypothetical protein
MTSNQINLSKRQEHPRTLLAPPSHPRVTGVEEQSHKMAVPCTVARRYVRPKPKTKDKDARHTVVMCFCCFVLFFVDLWFLTLVFFVMIDHIFWLSNERVSFFKVTKYNLQHGNFFKNKCVCIHLHVSFKFREMRVCIHMHVIIIRYYKHTHVFICKRYSVCPQHHFLVIYNVLTSSCQWTPIGSAAKWRRGIALAGNYY